MPLTWKDRVKQTVSAGGSGALTLSAASSGFQALGAGDDGLLFPYVIEDGTAWETGIGIYTHSGTSFARTLRYASSSGSALTVTTAAFVYIDINSTVAQGMDLAAQSIIPGGKLTLESGVPTSTTDQTAKTNIYYTPSGDRAPVIPLWDGNRWQPVSFSQVTFALGTLTSGKPYDIFGYLSSGALALEALVWTNDTTRATAVTIQDRWCKSGDKTRLYLGSFYTTATTTTEDSKLKRFVFNAYNRTRRQLRVNDATSSWTYGTAAWRSANNSTANRVQVLCGLEGASIEITAVGLNTGAAPGTGLVSIGEDSTSTMAAEIIGGYSANTATGSGPTGAYPAMGRLVKAPAVGMHYYQWLEYAEQSGITFYSGLATHKSGISGSFEA